MQTIRWWHGLSHRIPYSLCNKVVPVHCTSSSETRMRIVLDMATLISVKTRMRSPTPPDGYVSRTPHLDSKGAASIRDNYTNSSDTVHTRIMYRYKMLPCVNPSWVGPPVRVGMVCSIHLMFPLSTSASAFIDRLSVNIMAGFS